MWAAAVFICRARLVAAIRTRLSRVLPSASATARSNIMRGMLDLMPAPGLVFHEWDQHGTCSGLPPREYFDLVRRAREKVRIPEQYSDPRAPLTVTPSQVIDAFVSANEGLSPNGITVDCNRTRLREVRICLTRELQFRNCSASARGACRSERLIMPPVRGG